MQDVSLQAFHLSKPRKGATYIWADTRRQRYHDSFSSKHGDAGRKGSEIGQNDDIFCQQIPAQHSMHGKNPAQQILHGEDIFAKAQIQMERGKHYLHPDMSDAREHFSASGDGQNPAQLQLHVNGLSSESVSKMLALHARTERRAQSLIDKVHALRRDCNMLLTALPQQFTGCVPP